MFGSTSHRGGYETVEPREHEPLTAIAAWVPWSHRLNDILTAVHNLATANAASDPTEPDRRQQIVELGIRARVLMDQIRTQPALPGRYGDAVEVLRAPTNADPDRLAGALALLGSIADLAQPETTNNTAATATAATAGGARRGGSRRASRCPQSSLPGLELTPTIEGANQ